MTKAINYTEDEVFASASRSGSGDSGVLAGYAEYTELKAFFLLASVSVFSTGTATVFIEDTVDGTNFAPVVSASVSYSGGTVNKLTSIVATGAFSDRVRLRYVIGGGDTITCSAVLVAKR